MFKKFIRVASLVSLTFVMADGAFADDDDVMALDRTKANQSILHVCKIDGSPIRPLVADKEFRLKFGRQGTPSVSPDGKQVAFEVWAVENGFDWHKARICIVDIDGTNARDISDGNMPSFSPDGTKLVFGRSERYANKAGEIGRSIWICDLDGKNKKMLDDHGACRASWSPDGKSIVYYGGTDEDGESAPKSYLRMYDVETGKISNVFSLKESPFSKLDYYMKWSKEKKRTIAFGGRLKFGEASAVATIDVDKGRESLLFIELGAIGRTLTQFNWHPHDETLLGSKNINGKRCLASIAATEAEADTETKADAETESLFDGVPEKVSTYEPVYTPDAKNIIVAFRPAPGT